MTHVFRLPQRSALVIGVTGIALTLTACGGQTSSSATPTGSGTSAGSDNAALTGEVVIDGSSTVEPLSSAAATLFRDEEPGVNVTVATSGTGGGFKRFCAG